MNHKYLTTKQVSEMLNISVSTVKRYSEYGYIKYIRLQNSKHRRYIKSSIDKYLLDQGRKAFLKKLGDSAFRTDSSILQKKLYQERLLDQV